MDFHNLFLHSSVVDRHLVSLQFLVVTNLATQAVYAEILSLPVPLPAPPLPFSSLPSFFSFFPCFSLYLFLSFRCLYISLLPKKEGIQIPIVNTFQSYWQFKKPSLKDCLENHSEWIQTKNVGNCRMGKERGFTPLFYLRAETAQGRLGSFQPSLWVQPCSVVGNKVDQGTIKGSKLVPFSSW